jgi:hypothetical protein
MSLSFPSPVVRTICHYLEKQKKYKSKLQRVWIWLLLLLRRLFGRPTPDNSYEQKARSVGGAWVCTPRCFGSVSFPILRPILQLENSLLLFHEQEI